MDKDQWVEDWDQSLVRSMVEEMMIAGKRRGTVWGLYDEVRCVWELRW